MNIYKFELRNLKKSIMIWGLAVPFALVGYMLFYPMMSGDTAAFETLMANFPEEFLAAFGMNPKLPIFSLFGYFSLTFGMIQIPIAIQASNYGFHILSVEERELTADFLLSKPISRRKIFISKIMAAVTSLTIVNILVWVSSIAVIMIVKGEEVVDLTNVNILLSTTALLQLTFFGIGMVISVSIKKVSSVLTFSMALGFGLYIVASLGSILSSGIFKIISPFSHFNPGFILINGKYEWSLAIVSVIAIVVTIPLSYFLYNKRNIASL
ncbi:ABC transporter permease subunit [Mycoplasmatota bacterium]|nr:ABC transporter permease subunit [Mycoplasmatota bacterium]